MRSRRHWHRAAAWVPAGALAAVSLLAVAAEPTPGDPDPYASPSSAEAAPSASAAPSGAPAAVLSEEAVKQGCLDAFMQGQRLRNRSELLSSRARLVACGHASCPDVIRGKCIDWLEEVREAIPTVVVAATDAAGNDLVTAAVQLDGVAVAAAVDGTPIELDPGAHTLTVVHGKRTVSRQLVAVQGKKNRVVQVRFAKEAPAPPRVPAKPPADDTGSGLSTLSWSGFGVGAAGIVAGTVTGVVAIFKAREVKEECQADECNPPHFDDYNAALAAAHTSTITFSIGGAGLVVGVIGLFIGDPDPTEKPAAPAKPKTSLAPLLGPGLVGLTGRF